MVKVHGARYLSRHVEVFAEVLALRDQLQHLPHFHGQTLPRFDGQTLPLFDGQTLPHFDGQTFLTIIAASGRTPRLRSRVQRSWFGIQSLGFKV